MKFFTWLFIILAVLTVAYVGFGIWTEQKHDKSVIEYVQDKLKDDKQVEDEVVVETEDETATAVINW